MRLSRFALHASVLASAALAAACASAAAGDASRGGPPALGVSFGPPGQELRFHRTMQSTARNEALPASQGLPEGEFPGVEIRTFVEYLVAAGGADGSGRQLVDVRVGETAVSMRGIEGWNLAFDTRRPETLESPALAPGDREQLKERLAKARAPRRYVLPPTGKPEAAARDIAPQGEIGPEALPFGPPAEWFPGMLLCATLAGTAAEGSRMQFEGAFGTGMAGLTHGDVVAVAGSWRIATWDPISQTARLLLEAGPMSEKLRLRTTSVASCVVRGEATWDAARRLVTRSSVTSRIVLRLLDTPAEQIDWTMTVEEILVP